MRAKTPKPICIFRYPGGKSKRLGQILPSIPLQDSPLNTYVEPFIGGGSVALAVAQKFRSISLVLNDRDENISSFWSTIACGDKWEVRHLLALIEKRPSVEQFRYLRATKPTSRLDKAFRALFFNRTAFGGIANSGPLGGYEQRGDWKVDSRWNASKLTAAIIAARRLLRGRTVVLNEDFEPVIARANGCSFMYIDPPYYKAGNELYTSHWTDGDHVRLREALRGRDNWLLSYDAHPRIQEIYRVVMLGVSATYSIAKARGVELLLAQKLAFEPSPPGLHGIRDQLQIWVDPAAPTTVAPVAQASAASPVTSSSAPEAAGAEWSTAPPPRCVSMYV